MQYRNWIEEHIQIGHEVLYLTRNECIQTGLTAMEVFQLVEKSLIVHGKKELEMPAKIGIHPVKNSLMHAMPAHVPGDFACGIKWGTCFPDNRKRFGLDQTSCLMILNDQESGLPIAIMDGTWLTAVRTPAVTMVGVKYLANQDAETFGMIGCGVQGKEHVKQIVHFMPKLRKIYIFDIYEPMMDSLVDSLQEQIPVEIVKCKSFEELVKESEVIASATTILERPDPKISDEWIRPGQTILQCDLHSLYEDKTMKRADKYIVDSIEQHDLMTRYGYYPDGLPEIYGELGEVAAGLKKGRERNDEIIVNNNVGMAVEDIIVAKEIFVRALQQNLGRKLPL